MNGQYIMQATPTRNMVATLFALTLLCGGAGMALAAGTPVPSSFADIVEQIKPAVISVSVGSGGGSGDHDHDRRRRRGHDRDRDHNHDHDQSPQFNFPPGSMHDEFMRRFFGQSQPRARQPLPRQRPRRAVGSGFIIDADGYIVTNHHVIEDADQITVVLQDGTELEATVRGVDRHTDLALLKVNSDEPLPYVRFGDSDKARVGDWVIAIGNPFGLGGTTTSGIISARGRDIHSGPYDDFIQIDAPINRGNSGGPLFNTEGKVIGVNTAIISPNGGNIGIGFAVPAAIAQRVITDLRAGGAVERGWLGVAIQTLNDEIAEELGLEQTRGALVSQVMAGSPANAAGVEPGDVIVRYDGNDIGELRDLTRLVEQTKSGTTVGIEVWRDGKRRTLKAAIAVRDDSDPASLSELGMTLEPLDAATRRRHRLDHDANGVLVTGVEPGGTAARQGIRAGDRIVRAGRREVSQPEQVLQTIGKARKARRKSVLLLIERDNGGLFVVLPLA